MTLPDESKLRILQVLKVDGNVLRIESKQIELRLKISARNIFRFLCVCVYFLDENDCPKCRLNEKVIHKKKK